MIYINQRDYPTMEYRTNADDPNSDLYQNGTISRAGCGLCCGCMLVAQLTGQSFQLEFCRELSYEIKANHGRGTDMKLLAPALATRFDLCLQFSNDVEELLQCLSEGGAAIINVGGDRPGHTGVFSAGGHYIAAISAKGREVCVLDPSQRPDKYDSPERAPYVRVEGNHIYTDAHILELETANRTPGYYLFWPKNTPATEQK